jgi:hypothetical protein
MLQKEKLYQTEKKKIQGRFIFKKLLLFLYLLSPLSTFFYYYHTKKNFFPLFHSLHFFFPSTTMSGNKFLSVMMNSDELETAHELSVKSYVSNDSFSKKNGTTTPLVKKTKSKVKTANGKRFFNNPYYAGTPLAALAAAVKKTNNSANNHHAQGTHPRSGNRSGNSSTTKLAARAYKLQLQAYQAAQARIVAEQEKQDQQYVDVIVSAESSLSRGATLGNFAEEQPKQPIISVCAPLEPMMSSKNNSSFLGSERQGSSYHYDYNNNNNNNANDLENFSFTSQQFLASQPQQQPQQPQQPQFLAVAANNNNHRHQFNQSVSGLSSSSSGAGSEDERHMMQQHILQSNNNSKGFVAHHNVAYNQQQQYDDQQPEQPTFTDDFLPPQPKSLQQQAEQQQHKYAPNTTFVVVMFKYELCSFQCRFVVCQGDWVVVQADRGEHVGRVQSVTTEPPVFHVPYQILRHANFTEIASVEANHPRETQAAQRIHQIAMDLQLPLAITDTEFYSDGNKMTVFFSSKTTVDFRELQRRVFREFRRRIWLINNAEVQYRNRNCRNRK